MSGTAADRIEITNFDIRIDKTKVLKALGCSESSGVYNVVSSYFDELEPLVYGSLKPRAAAVVKGNSIYCLLTAGGDVSVLSKSLFDKGEGMRGLLADAMADEYLFAMDDALYSRIRQECAVINRGVGKRLDAPKDFPLSKQEVIVRETAVSGTGLTEAFMLTPVKSMCYILELTDDAAIFLAQHNCAKCGNRDCPRRSIAPDGFKALSGYEYEPRLGKGESAVCVDIGTTTVVFELITDSGAVSCYKTVNPQRRFGLDVISRIEAAVRGRGGELSALIRYTLLNGISEVTKGFTPPDRIAVAGNTTMIHLLMGYPCKPLGVYPFSSEHLAPVKSTLETIIGSGGDTEVCILGGISAFVGADAVSGMYMCDFDLSDKVNLFLDLGTNGEMAIGNKNRILTASAAAGPAFEGGRISCGVGSVDGAICGIDLKEGRLATIADKPPVGLCGTGIIELCAELLSNGIMDKTGLLSDNYFHDGYTVAEGIVFTQTDIRQVQMAKAAVRAGINTLMSVYGTDAEGIDTLYLAGGFGHSLSPKKACDIGLFPRELEGRVKIIGNSSLGGLAKFCERADGESRTEHIREISSEVSLTQNESFQELYMRYMNFC